MRGSLVVIIVLIVLAAYLFIGFADLMGGGASLGETIAWYSVLAAFLGGSALFAFFDLYAFAAFTAVASIAGGGLVWLVASVSAASTGVAIGISALSALVFVASAGFLIWTAFAHDSIPDVIRLEAAPQSITEKNGVQLALHTQGLLATDSISPVFVVLQNCTDATRTVAFSLFEAPLLPAKPALSSRVPDAVVLGPSEVKRVRFPICATPAAKYSVLTTLKLRVKGARGRRTRRRRARPHAMPTTLLQIAVVSVLMLPLGFMMIVTRRDGLTIRFLKAGPPRSAGELPEPTVETLWAPASALANSSQSGPSI